MSFGSSTADNLAPAGTALPALRTSLGRLRMRWRWHAMLAGAALSLIAALVVLCGLEALAIISGEIGPLSGLAGVTALPLSSALTLSAVAFGVALAVASVVVCIVTPDIATLARAAERELALRERFSTALEVDAGRRPDAAPGPVRTALLGDAERCAVAIDPRRLVRLTLPRASWAVPVLIGVAAILQWLPPDAFGVASHRGSGAGPQSAAGALAETPDAATAANLRRIAELLAKDADARSDPYLRSVARTLERLSAEIERTAPNRRALAQELDRLLLHTQQAYAQGANAGIRQSDRTAAVPEAARLLQQARDELSGRRQADAAAPVEAGAEAQSAAAARAQTDRPQRAPARETPGGRLTEPSGQLRQAAAADALKDLDAYDLADVDPRLRAERAFADEQRRQRAAAAAAAGAATDAGKGDGDRAGDGTRPLGGDATAGAELTPGADMLLPEAANDGRRIRIELTPETQLSGVAPPAAAAGDAWRRIPEQPVERPALDAENRKVVGRYFARPAEGVRP